MLEHWFNVLFNELDFFVREPVFGVQLLVYIRYRHVPIYITLGCKVLHRYICPSFTGIILSDFQCTEHCTSKPCLYVFQTSISLGFGIKYTNTNKSICITDNRHANNWCGQYFSYRTRTIGFGNDYLILFKIIRLSDVAAFNPFETASVVRIFPSFQFRHLCWCPEIIREIYQRY